MKSGTFSIGSQVKSKRLIEFLKGLIRKNSDPIAKGKQDHHFSRVLCLNGHKIKKCMRKLLPEVSQQSLSIIQRKSTSFVDCDATRFLNYTSRFRTVVFSHECYQLVLQDPSGQSEKC